MAARIDNIVTAGKFRLDGGAWDVENNVWLVGDDDEVLVIDAAHDADAIVGAVNGRNVRAIVCTHGHNDHINAAQEVSQRTGAPIWLHPDDRMLWDEMYPQMTPDAELADGQRISIAGTELSVLHTPGHAPGAVCLYAPDLGALFSGDTLFNGGPGATGRSYSDFPTIVESIRQRLLTLPEETTVHPGHGDGTVIGEEKPHVQEWIDRGH
jgi:glyoxylase-like metal-dependent hydrolase (beta-lactamase superfamily II)